MERIRELFRSRPIFAWALYDWANSVFATTVIAGFFPVFFKQYWSAGADAVTSTAQLGFANSIGSVFILVAVPVLGAVADGGAARKRYSASSPRRGHGLGGAVVHRGIPGSAQRLVPLIEVWQPFPVNRHVSASLEYAGVRIGDPGFRKRVRRRGSHDVRR